jgi:hypothetical protein
MSLLSILAHSLIVQLTSHVSHAHTQRLVAQAAFVLLDAKQQLGQQGWSAGWLTRPQAAAGVYSGFSAC